MRRLSLAAFVLLISSFASATATVSGKLVNPDTTGGIPGYAQFDLENCGGNFPIVTGASIAPRQTFTLANDGTWSGVMYRNDEITCNGSASTWWRMTYFVNSRQAGPARDFICSQASCAFDSMTPLLVYPALPSPIPVSGSVLTAPLGPQTITGGFGLINTGPVTGTTLTGTSVVSSGAITGASIAVTGAVTGASETTTTSPAGLTQANPVQSLGNAATTTLLADTWSSMGFGADIVPSGSTQIEMDGLFGFIEGASTTTANVGVRGQAQPSANSVKAWGGNFLATDYDHVPNTYTGVTATGIEVDLNTKSSSTVGAGIQIQSGNANFATVVPTLYPALEITAQNGGGFSHGIIINNGSLGSGGLGLQLGSQGATGVINKASTAVTGIGYNGAGAAKGWTVVGSKDGDVSITTESGRGVGINLGGTVTAPTEPGTALDVSGTTRSTAFATATNCAANSVSPAACAAAASGVFSVPATTTTYTVNTSAVTANSRIFIQQTTDNTGIPTSPTCNGSTATPVPSARSAATSFTFALASIGNITCFQYWIVN